MRNGLLLAICTLFGPLDVQHLVPQDPAPTLHFHGRVLDAAGQPLADAGIVFGPSDQASTAAALAQPRVRTGADGTFEIAVEQPGAADWTATDVLLIAAPGKVGLWCPSVARLAGFGAHPDETRVDLGEIRLPNGVTLRGRVRGNAGKPVAGARVRALDCLSTHSWMTPSFGGQVITGEDGRFTLPGVFANAMAITVAADGHYTTTLPAVNLGDPLDMTLEESGFVEGTVLDAEGKPWQGPVMATYECAGEWAATTTVDGRFRFSVSMPCRFRVTARDASGWTADSRILDGPASGVELRFAGADQKWFVVRAIDAETGEAVRSFRAAATWFEEELSDNGEDMLTWMARESRPDGKAWLDAPGSDGFPSGGKGVVRVVAEGYGPLLAEKVQWQENEEFVAKLTRAARIEGRVVDAKTGEPVAGVEVACVRARKKTGRTMASRFIVPVLTAKDGSFGIDGLAAGSHELTANRREGTTLLSRKLELKAGQVKKDLQLDLPPGVTVAGRVQAAKLGPGWMVLLAPEKEETGEDAFDDAGSALEAWNCKGAVRLAADGSFRFEHRRPATEQLWLVMPMAPRQGSALRIPVQAVKVGKDDLLLEVDVATHLPGSITGKLGVAGAALPAGRLAVVAIPVERDRVGFQPHSERIRSRHWTLADDGGVFAFPVAPSNYRLEVIDVATGVVLGKSQENGEVRSGKPTTMDLRIEAVEMTIEFETAHARHGADRLQVHAGEEAANSWQWDVTLFGGGQHGSPGVDLRGVERRVRFYVPPGSVKVSISAASRLARGSSQWSGEEQTETFEAETGKPAQLTMKLPPPKDLDGK